MCKSQRSRGWQTDQERLFVLGQLCTYIEQVSTGAKLAAQFGCHARHVEWIEETAAKEDCRIVVDKERQEDRVAIWVFKHEYVGKVIAGLCARSTTPPNIVEVWCMGKLFGYSDHEIGKFLNLHGFVR